MVNLLIILTLFVVFLYHNQYLPLIRKNVLQLSILSNMILSMITLYFLVQSRFIHTRSQQVESDSGLLVVKTIQSLAKSISYFQLREDRVTADELLGLRIAKDALLRVVENCVGSPGIYVPNDILEDIKLLCAKFNVLIPRVLNIYNHANITQGFKKYISSEWPGFLPYKSINIEKQDRIDLQIMDKAVPLDFQLCIGDLNQLGKKCIISVNCFKILEPKMAPASVIVDQAVILSTLQLLGCSSKVNDKWKKITVEELSDDICYKLYPKVSSFHDSDTNQEGDDVLSFLDAFFVCTLLGFEDFLQVTHLRISDIIKWQLPRGCFGIEMTIKDGTVKDGRCLPEMTSVAVGQLGLYLKWLIDPKGFALSSRNQPFKKPGLLTFFLLKILFVIFMLSPFFVRKIRRGLWVVLGRFLSLFKSFFRL